MNIGEFVKNIKKEYPSISISKVRFLEKEGFLNPIRSKGGTRNFTNKYIDLVKQILNLQENYFYSLKAIKKDKSLLKSNQKKLKKHNNEIKMAIINASIKKLKKNYYDPRAKKVINLIRAIDKKGFKKSTLGGCIFFKKGINLCLKKEKL